MIPYNQKPIDRIQINGKIINSFLKEDDANIDKTTVKSFGQEWEKFSAFKEREIEHIGNQYFDITDESILNKNTIALDVGCGSGRWSRYLTSKVKFIEAIDPSKSVLFALQQTSQFENVRVSQAGVDNIPFEKNSFDFVFSLGVLHHIPNTKLAMQKSVDVLKPNGHFLVYLYYNLDNRGLFFKTIFKTSNILRKIISSLPHRLKSIVCDVISVTIYMPLVLLARFFRWLLKNESYKKIPLSYYADKNFFVIRNDALDRFGTPLEQRFSKEEIKNMMEECGLVDITFSDNEPYWHALGKKTKKE